MAAKGKKAEDKNTPADQIKNNKIKDAPPSPPASPKGDESPQATTAATIGASSSQGSRSNATAEAVAELLKTMQNTLGSLGKTFDLMGDQTMQVASLGPAVDALYQIAAVRSDLDDQHAKQEQEMQQVRVALQDNAKRHLRETLRPTVNKIVAAVVKQAVADRVQQELAARITSSLRDEIEDYKLQVLRVKASLHNSEARRRNALIRASSLEEPLEPLLRPLDAVKDAPNSAAPSKGSPRPGAGRGRVAADIPINRLSIKTDARSVRTSAAVTALEVQGGVDGGPGLRDIDVPTPSPLFPPNLMSLVSLGPEDAKALIRDYGLVSYEGDEGTDKQVQGAAVRRRGGVQGSRPDSTSTGVSSDGGRSWADAGLRGSREDDLNRFMRHIGVGFQVLPTSPSGNSSKLETIVSPLIERPDYAFSR